MEGAGVGQPVGRAPGLELFERCTKNQHHLVLGAAVPPAAILTLDNIVRARFHNEDGEDTVFRC